MAARGTRNMGQGEERIEDTSLVMKLKEKARAINRRAMITSALVTLLTVVFPDRPY